MQFDSIKALVEQDFQSVNSQILACLHSKAGIINDLGRYIVQAGGKRLRPLVVLLIARACGYSDKHHTDLATIVELIHTATLLHDDVVDNATLRRGRETANHAFGNQAAVLVGDFLYTKAFQLMLQVTTPTMMKVLADATNRMAEGEALQLMDRHNPEASEGNYLNIIQSKTAKLFETAAQLAALIAKVDDKHQKAMARYGLHLGTAFQLIDDLLDYQIHSKQTGKTVGNDLAEGKVTLPLIYLLQNGSPAEIHLVREAIQSGGQEYLPKVQQMIETSGALQYTMRFARIEVARAQKELELLPASTYREGAKALAQFALERSN